MHMRQPENYKKQSDGKFKCLLCPNFCVLEEGQTGKCLSRGVRNGNFQLLNYGHVVAAGVDPIEKKPLYHFFPGRAVLSVGSYGCNLRCKFCQNSDISQFEQPSTMLTPEQLLQKAFNLQDNIGVAFTYNEPGIWYEYILDCAAGLHDSGLKVILVTNGFLCSEPFKELCKVSDAMNIDLKAFNQEFYKDECQGEFEAVKNNIVSAVESGIHLELTNLVITGLNDSEEEFRKMVDWIASLNPDIPFHISRYFPRYLETAPATKISVIEHFVEVAKEKLNFVYAGNIAGNQNTCCKECGKILVERTGYFIKLNFEGNKCECGCELPFVLD